MTSSNIVSLVPPKEEDWEPNKILEEANKHNFEGVTVVGWLKEPGDNGKRFWISSSYVGNDSVSYSLTCAQHFLMKQVFGETMTEED